MPLSSSLSRLLFCALWFLLLMIQASRLELSGDEAYYWMYSQELAWGFFDHPPFIALLIKVGYSIFPNEMGVRLLPALLSSVSIYLLAGLIEVKKEFVFYLLILSVAILHFISLLSTTDAPLLFSTCIFLITLKRYLSSTNFKNALFLGLSMALMLYSKYHGFLIITLCFLPQLSLLKKKSFYLALAFGAALLLPHLIWQFQHNFPSVHYHFFERSREPYALNNTLEYLGVQLILLGPISGLLFFWASIKMKARNSFEKSLKVMFWGAYLTFFLLSFQGRVEAHWTLFSLLPGMYFAQRFLESHASSWLKWRWGLGVSVALIIGVRILLYLPNDSSFQLLPHRFTKRFDHREDMLKIAEVAKSMPVAFMNSYQKASLFQFYTSSPAFSLNNIMGRKNQFDLWEMEDRFRGEDVLIIPNYDLPEFTVIEETQRKERYVIQKNLQCFSKLQIEALDFPNSLTKGDSISVKIIITNKKNDTINLEANPQLGNVLHYRFLDANKVLVDEAIMPIGTSDLDKVLDVKLNIPELTEIDGLYFTINSGWLPASINGSRIPIKIKD